jgi:hypothetical protein
LLAYETFFNKSFVISTIIVAVGIGSSALLATKNRDTKKQAGFQDLDMYKALLNTRMQVK